MLRSPLFHYALCFICVKYSNFGKHWDYLLAGVVAAGLLMACYFLWDLLMSLLRNGKHGIAFTAIMTFGIGYWICGEVFGTKWLLEFDNPVIDETVRWVMGIFAVGYLVVVIRFLFSVRREED